jgi:methylthioribose-1-phosphate isomerase
VTVLRVLEWHDGTVRFLDQTLLPDSEQYVVASDEAVLAEAIQRLAIRGAPLIGIAAAYGVALAAFHQLASDPSRVVSRATAAADLLAATRPTAVNLFWALERQRRVLRRQEGTPAGLAAALLAEARRLHEDDRERCERISLHGLSLLPAGSTALTHCNTGALATGGRGTAFGIITLGHERGIVRHLIIDETRPLLQGARLTAWEAQRLGIPCTLIHDSAAAALMRERRVDAVIVGADRIAANGDTANKVGTYGLAVAARHHQIPFYVAAPTSSIDLGISDGSRIPIERRASDEVAMLLGRRIAPAGVVADAPAFDVTPAGLITAIVTDQGIARGPFDTALRAFVEDAYGGGE